MLYNFYVPTMVICQIMSELRWAYYLLTIPERELTKMLTESMKDLINKKYL